MMRYPDLWWLRRGVLPTLERINPSVKFSFEKNDGELAGCLDLSPYEARRFLRGRDNVYVNNLAAQKYVVIDGERVYAQGSYAYRPEGRFGTWQTHLYLFEHEKGTAVFAHHELNPLSRPDDHYGGEDWSAEKGVEIARELLSLHTDCSFEGIQL